MAIQVLHCMHACAKSIYKGKSINYQEYKFLYLAIIIFGNLTFGILENACCVGFEIRVKNPCAMYTERLFILSKKFVDDEFGKSAFVFFKRLQNGCPSIPKLFCKLQKCHLEFNQ